ncbi:hypothetical protein NNJEOMEG_00150 [Fundidesulfovibrio magnetotacticus]|uniref:Uncharacterized protein n=1 Tax=Fundidesulfovibrio magnetotacticus TaxID=2730080 RepID=A0A6V8LRC7_9BACT|nr:hypothetical protein [Fundidesulfovibrio magnetotacticus]GFK92326.1 hypothetical protein NNJEOMEG_00150 [Fundidesulfovibrio magnetotacticus]
MLGESWRMFEGASGIRAKPLLYFFLAAAGAALTATGIYWAVYGYKHWNGEMAVAGRILTAAASVPVRAPAPAAGTGQYVCPVHGAVGMPRFDAAGLPRCPVGGEAMQFRGAVVAGATPAAFAGG